MILASAICHSVGRPATGMGGGTKNPMERLCQPPSDVAFVYIVNNQIQHRPAAQNLSEIRLTMRRIFLLEREDKI